MAAPQAQPAPLRRRRDGALIGGVCAGLGPRMGIDPLILRVGFVIATVAGGVGIALYLACWILIPADAAPADGRFARVLGRRESWQVAGGIVLLTLAALLLFRAWGIWLGDAVVWPLVLASGGGALIWRQSQRTSVVEAPPRAQAKPGGGAGRPRRLRLSRPSAGYVALGACLIFGAALVFLWLNGALVPDRDVTLAVFVVVVALALLLAPWWLRLTRGLTEERAERIRTQERAEVAAHLHDSVLQTLALMQKRADDPREVAALARRQERELRAWLNGSERARDATLAAALEAAVADIEDAHGVPVDVVAVGDRPLDDAGEALVAAAREAVLNAVKFAPDAAISVFAEVSGDARRGVRPRPRAGLRPGRGARRPARAARVRARADGAPRRPRRDPHESRGGDRGRAGDGRMTRVVLVDDHGLFRAGVRAELDGLVDILGDAGSVGEAIDCIVELEPDVVLLDVQMPDGGGAEVIRAVAPRRPAVRFLALSVSDAPEDVISIIRAGARGYVTKTISGPELADAVNRVASGDAVFSPRLAGFVLDAFAGHEADAPTVVDPELDLLTAREREVLRHIARGYLYKEIAQRLGISVKTVEAHVSAVLRKLQLSNRHELSRWAVQRGWLE